MLPEAPLFVQLQERCGNLPPNQRTLARYVLENYQAVAFANVKELARMSGVSEATIIRFTRSLGFAGYPGFQQEIRRLVRADLKGTERFELTKTAKKPGHGTLGVVIQKELENITHLDEMFDQKAFRAALKVMRSASEVVVVGSRSTASLASHLCFGLNKIGLRATRIMSITTETYDFLNRLDRKACVILIGFPRHLRETINLLAFMKKRSAKTVCITDSPFSPLRGEINLYVPVESASFVGFHCAPLILINTLLHELSLVDKQKTLGALSQFEVLAGDEGYFHRN